MPLVHVVLDQHVRHREWSEQAPAQALLDQRGEVRGGLLVCDGGEGVCADKRVDLEARAGLHVRVEGHGEDEGLENRGELEVA